MKIIHLSEAIDNDGRHFLTIFTDEEDGYYCYEIYEDGTKLKPKCMYPKAMYGDDYRRFGEIVGKFDPYLFLLSEPLEVDSISYEYLNTLPRDKYYLFY